MQPDTVLHALTEKYAELLGAARDHEEKAASIREDIAHMEHVMRLYREGWTGDGVKPRRPSYPSRYLKVGQGVQTALDVLREAQRPMTVREVVFAIMDRLEIERTPKAIKSLESSIRFCLAKRVGQELVEVGRDPIRFAVAPSPLDTAA